MLCEFNDGLILGFIDGKCVTLHVGGQQVSVNIKDFLDESKEFVPVTIKDVDYEVDKGYFRAVEVENGDDIEFLDALASEIQQHDKILFKEVKPLIYLFDNETPDIVDTDERTLRRIFYSLVYKIAKETSMGIYAYIESPTLRITDKSVERRTRGKKKKILTRVNSFSEAVSFVKKQVHTPIMIKEAF